LVSNRVCRVVLFSQHRRAYVVYVTVRDRYTATLGGRWLLRGTLARA
jgi:hypothetical protein